MMNMGDDWAAPQIAEPTSKMKKKTRKLHCVLSENIFGVGLGNVMYLYRELAVDFAAQRLERCTSELVGAAIPGKN
jgi:hypothetical protein